MSASTITHGRATTARVAYLLVILVATLTNLGFEPSLVDVHLRLIRALQVSPQMHDVVDAARNIVLFAGLGAVWLATTRSPHPLRSIMRVTLLGCALSIGVETLQLFSPIRNASILDVITDTIGTFAGAAGTLAALEAGRARLHRESYVGIPAFIFAVSYAAAVAMEAFLPLLRQNLLRNLGGGPGARIGRALAAFDPHSLVQLPFTDFILFFPAGVFAVAAAAELGKSPRATWPLVSLVGAIVMIGIEVAHGVASAPILLGAIVMHVIAISAGAFVAARFLPAFLSRLDMRARPRFVLVAYAAVIMAWSWRPFHLEIDRASMMAQFSVRHLVPLRALALRADLFSVTDVIAQFVLFLPLGALLAGWPLRRSGAFRALLPALYLSIILEVGKILVAERFMDVTHILIQCAGAAIGWMLVRRAGYRPYGELLD
jgi:glycopeptide antibiotics resistance protein